MLIHTKFLLTHLKTDLSLTKQDRINRLRYILNGVLGTFKLAGQLSDSLSKGVNDSLFDDLEDSYQAHIAEDIHCDFLLTINEKHFSQFAKHSTVRVTTPIEFIEKYL